MRLCQAVYNLVGRQQLAHEQIGRLFVAIVYQFARFTQAVSPGCAQCNQYYISTA